LVRDLQEHHVANLGSYPSRYHAASATLGSYDSMVRDTDAARGVQLAQSWAELLLASGSTHLSASTQLQALDQVERNVHSQVDQISAPTQLTVTLTSASGKIPFSVSNPLPYPVRVTLGFQSAKLQFVHGPHLTVLLAAGQPTHLEIPVTARASGAFPMQITITSPDGGLVITRTSFDVRSTAVSGIGLILTVAAGAFLLLWWARHFRDTRRRRGLVESTHPVLRGS
jgi:hypothetical protein